ncbi:11366_t:CDS:2, partial [Gigaspora rosea]
GTSQNELTIVIDDTQTPLQLSLAVSNSSRLIISLTNSDSSIVLNDNIHMHPENSDEPLFPENSDEPLPSENSVEPLPLVNSGEPLPPEDSGESLPLVGSESEAMDLYSNSDLIEFNNNSRSISSLSTSRPTSSVHRFWCNYNNCGRTFRSQGEWQEHQYQHYGGSPFICLVEGCASFGTTYSSKSNLRRHYRQRHSNQSHPEFQNTI